MTEAEIEKLANALEGVLQGMRGPLGPGKLWSNLRFTVEDRNVVLDVDAAVEFLRAQIKAGVATSPIHRIFAKHLRAWDAADAPAWAEGTEQLTSARRALICRRLNLDADTIKVLAVSTPVASKANEAVLIAEDHQEWYTDERRRQVGTFYWDHYKKYLGSHGNWTEDSIGKLDRATDKIVKCLSDPERLEAFKARGLVVGYVQSGKTANFTALIAKALDAGYRMVIVLAGTLDSLRQQTQRRLDKELCGREQIERDADHGQPSEYAGDKDWGKFNSYGVLPSKLDAVDIKRITTSRGDYQGLGQGREVLLIRRKYPDRPLNHRDNLKVAEARLLVIKKNPFVIKKLMKDLKNLKTDLGDVPILIIDDESDQASVNTVDPKKFAEGKAKKDRTSTNQEIINLLKFFPRSQYVGYTATPAANTLINPGDSLDLFPRHFIELLPRPDNYMGVRDFHDFDKDFNPLDDEEVEKLGFRSNKRAFVHLISNAEEQVKLKEALDAFILSGSVKLFRNAKDKDAVSIRHHTMLVHRASRQEAHDDDRDLVRLMIVENAYRKSSSLVRLWKLWKDDFEPVSLAQEPSLERPASLEELAPFLEKVITTFEDKPNKGVLIVNGDKDNKDDTPNFEEEDVWAILVGGAKLSRGYTVEGLTTTFFLRRAGAGDTLMQMGRWFGFRRGYRDLVRLYIGSEVSGGRSKTVDLYEMFESICMDEERFRQRIAIYSNENITPIQVPPLVPMGMLPPTQKNKMHFAEIRFENYGDQSPESGRVTMKEVEREKNADLLRTLLAGSVGKYVSFVGYKNGESSDLNGMVYPVTAEGMKKFIADYKWGTKENQFAGVITFLNGSGETSPEIDSWLVAIVTVPKAKARWSFDSHDFGTFGRTYVGTDDDGRFKVFSESRHRNVAKHLVSREFLTNPSSDLVAATKPNQAVCLVYPTIKKDSIAGAVPDEDINLGLTLVFPRNSIKQKIDFQVSLPNLETSDANRKVDEA